MLCEAHRAGASGGGGGGGGGGDGGATGASQALTEGEAWAEAAALGLKLVSSKNETGFKGVYKHLDKYVARVKKDGKFNRLGTFETPVEAALYYAKHIRAMQTAAEAHVR